MRAHSSVGQSGGLIIRWSEVQVLLGPPEHRDALTRGVWVEKSRTRIRNKDFHANQVHSAGVHFFIASPMERITGPERDFRRRIH
jgi:hypothetical protein